MRTSSENGSRCSARSNAASRTGPPPGTTIPAVACAAGTVFDKTRTPLSTWFDAARHVTTGENGMSSVTLAETLAETLGMSCQLAWPMLHRYRVTMVRADRAPLVDEAKVDETVAAGSVVLTDGWGGYKRGPVRARLRPQGDLAPDLAHVIMPSVHRVASLLTGWIFGTRRGSVDPLHLQAYLEVLSPVQPTHLTSRGLSSVGSLCSRLHRSRYRSRGYPQVSPVGPP